MQVNIAASDLYASAATVVEPGSFEPARHFYPRVLNAQIHPMVSFFMRMSPEKLINRYCHLHPRVNPAELANLLRYEPRHLRWTGADLFHVTTEAGNRKMVVIEVNSCPSGNKSMPTISDDEEQGGFRTLLERAFLPLLKKRGLPRGGLAVIYDKNRTETSGYAAALADLTGEKVYLTPMASDDSDPCARFDDGVLHVRDESGEWQPIRAAFRYVTQKPWNRIPISTRTIIFNPVVACLAGGRNKLVADKAFELYAPDLEEAGLNLILPETVRDIRKAEIPLWVGRFGGQAVVKIPYSNAGQGVFTITSEEELEKFMETESAYDSYIVQSLIGNYGWSSTSSRGRLYHVGTMPNRHGKIFVADLRMMISTSSEGYRPLAIYARRARAPLAETLAPGQDSWDILGTNLSRKREDGGWDSDDERLLLMDRKDFNTLGLGLDDLIEGFIQTVLAAVSVDRMARDLMTKKGKFKKRLFQSLNDDKLLTDEIWTPESQKAS